MNVFDIRARLHLLTLISWFLLLTPFVVYGLYIFQYATNVPVLDDYVAALIFLNKFTHTQALREQASLLFSQHNEHRIVFDRIVFLCHYYLFHEINFKHCILFGNVGWLLATSLFVQYSHKNFHLSLTHLLPIPYLLLSFSHWENMFYAMAAIQNYWFVFFSLAFLICLSTDKVFLFCLLFCVSLFTSGGAIALYPLGNLFLLLQRKWKPFGIFFVLSTLLLAFYFYGYEKPPHHPSIIDAILTPIRTVVYLFTFWGNILPFNSPPLMSIFTSSFFVGVPLCVLSVYLLMKRQGDQFLHLVISLVGFVGLEAALTRSGFGVWQAAGSRYSMFPLLALACTYIGFVTTMPKRSILSKVVVTNSIFGAILLWGFGIVALEHTPSFYDMKAERIASIMAFHAGSNEKLLHANKEAAAQVLSTAEQQGIYNYRD
jgi:hypothetical protein